MYLILAKLEAYPRLKKEDKSSRSDSIKKPVPCFCHMLCWIIL